MKAPVGANEEQGTRFTYALVPPQDGKVSHQAGGSFWVYLEMRAWGSVCPWVQRALLFLKTDQKEWAQRWSDVDGVAS